jgi:hypothetical protein
VKFRGSIENILKTDILIISKNLKEMDTFLDVYDLTKLNKEDINHLIKFTIRNKIEAAIISQERKAQG